MPGKRKETVQSGTQCEILYLPGRGERALCKIHGVYLIRAKVEIDLGKTVDCWRCPTSGMVVK